jgi:hypothetical protein
LDKFCWHTFSCPNLWNCLASAKINDYFLATSLVFRFLSAVTRSWLISAQWKNVQKHHLLQMRTHL